MSKTKLKATAFAVMLTALFLSVAAGFLANVSPVSAAEIQGDSVIVYEKTEPDVFTITGISAGSLTSIITTVLVFLKKRRRKSRKTVEEPEAADASETLEMVEEFKIEESDEE